MQDTTGGIYCAIPLDQPDVTSGDEVEVRGTRSGGIFAPMIENTQLKFLRHGTLPRPQKLTAEKIISQRFDSRWIEMEGTLHSVASNSEEIILRPCRKIKFTCICLPGPEGRKDWALRGGWTKVGALV